MRVTVNGEARDIAATSVDALLRELDYEGTHFAIAVNYDVVPKRAWPETCRDWRRDRDHHTAAGRVRMTAVILLVILGHAKREPGIPRATTSRFRIVPRAADRPE